MTAGKRQNDRPERESDRDSGRRLERSLERKIAVARAAVAWERLWPALWPPLAILTVYTAGALGGLWQALPGWCHWLAALGTLAGTGFFAWRIWQDFEAPTDREAMRWLESRAGLPHRPLSGLADTRASFAGSRDEGGALWAAHRARVLAAVRNIQIRLPRPATALHDPMALRVLVVMLLAISVVSAGSHAGNRLAAGLLPPLSLGTARALAIDAWVTPPAYTGEPPVFLNHAEADPAAPVTVPQGSILTARVHQASSTPELRIGGTATTFEATGAETAEANAPLDASGTAAITVGGRKLAEWALTVTPDEPPIIDFAEGDSLALTPQQSIAVTYNAIDDYGLASAEMRVTLPSDKEDSEEAAGETEKLGALVSIEPPVLALPLPGLRAKEADEEVAFFDLTDHPWAGLPVEITLAATDDAKQTGLSPTRTLRLPQREFNDPVARAVIEQRQHLARAPEEREAVAFALNALTLHPDRYFDTAQDYLPLRAAYWRIKQASKPGDLDGIFEFLWEIALHFEDGDLSLAEKELRDAQDALADALANDAPDEEIERLMDKLRSAMDRFLRALAQNQLEQGEQAQMPLGPNAQAITRQDLEGMLDALQELARSGSREAARQLLSDMRNLLEHLQDGMPGQPSMTPPQSAMNDAINEMGEMIQRQRGLQDDTFQKDQGARPGQQGGSNKSPGALAGEQGALRNELEALREGLGGSGVESPAALGRAERAMREAEQALRSGDLDGAVRRQGEAIDSLREGAQALAETLLEELAQSGEGQGGQASQGVNGRDPLGRPQSAGGSPSGSSVELPSETDVQRARRILEELQRRAGERQRPPVELDYLNRLLRRF